MFGWLGRKTKKMAKGAGRIAGFSLTKRTFNFVKDIFITIFKPKTATQNETFEQVVERLQLTPEALEDRKKMFKVQILLYSLSALLAGAYTVYLCIHGYWLSIAASFFVTVFLIVSSLKSHFWLFQVKNRKLGCTIEEWLNASIKESQ